MPWGTNSNRIVPPDWKSRKARVLRRDQGVCWLCHHPGAEEVDHIVNVASGGGHEYGNLAAIHGRPCATCDRRCHIEKTAQESATARAAIRAKGKHPVEQHPGLRRQR